VSLLPHAQVRDVTGDSAVLKRRLQEGEGEFPVDCPLHDTSVRLHYRARSLAGGAPGPWVFDTRSTAAPASSSNGDASSPAAAAGSRPDSGSGGPVEVDTGCGELPEGLELVVKLMVPGELALATCTPRYAYQVSHCTLSYDMI
jgi:hypothetical protein